MKNSNYHTPVLLKEAVSALKIKKGEKYIDATLGGGGHSEEILKLGGIVLGIDKDIDAINESKSRLKGGKITLVNKDFRDIDKIAQENDFYNSMGILVDSGTSVHQLKNKARGFSFLGHDLIDMRMDTKQKISAKDIINNYSKNELEEIFMKYGEEGEARHIAEQIVSRRKSKPILYTDELAEIILNAQKNRRKDIHPATKVFQALRIAVNDELSALREVLDKGIKVLDAGGRIAVISFHSLEDRIVKQKFRELENKKLGKLITKKAIVASLEELDANRKARSAKLRVFEKI